MLRVEIEGLESIKTDLDNQMNHINSLIPKALHVVGEELVASLQKHVNKDVYAAYKPKVYKRTGEMADPANMNVSVQGNTLHFEYRFDTKSAKPYFTDSDDVIAAVQDSSYLWNVGALNIPERPYWDNFIMEALGDGKVDNALARGLNRYDAKLNAKAEEGSIIPDGNDTTSLHGGLRGSVVGFDDTNKED